MAPPPTAAFLVDCWTAKCCSTEEKKPKWPVDASNQGGLPSGHSRDVGFRQKRVLSHWDFLMGHGSSTTQVFGCIPARERGRSPFVAIRARVRSRAKLSALRSRSKCLSGYSPPYSA